MGRQIVHKRGVFSRQIGRLDMIREKLERIGRANVMLVATPRITSLLFGRLLSDADLALLERPESFGPVV